jgi:NodT family efflux transporter outer membrane factor (OMF) lipoprotein
VKRLAIVAGLALLAAGCSVGPSYRRPAVSVPEKFKEEITARPPGEWKPGEARDAEERGKWWKAFGEATLDALEEKVDVSNQNVAQAQARYRIARASVKGSRADWYPTISAGGSATRSHAEGSTTSTYRVPGELQWEADVWGKVRRGVESAIATAQATAADLEAMRLSMHAELAADYFELRGLDAQKALLDTNAAAYEKALKLTVNKHDQGVVSGIDVAEAQTQLESTRVQAIDLGIARARFEHAIAVLTGEPPGKLTLPPSPELTAPPEIPPSLPSELLERRPDVAAAERRVAAANASIGVAESAFFPQLSLSASAGWQSSTLTRLLSAPNWFWSIAPAILETIFDGGKRRAYVEQAKASTDAAAAAYRQAVLSAFQDVEDALAATRILAEESAQQARAVEAADRALKLAVDRYQGGVTSYLEVITAQAAALANERQAVEVATRRLTTAIDLVRALGGGWGR